jgi:protein-S-isoprenylcysteine O-methyltransferase Ste14
MMYFVPVFKAGIWNAWIFMSVFIIQMLIIMLAGEKVNKRSHIPAEARLNKSEKYTSVIANIVWLAALLYSVFLPFKPGTILFYAGLFAFMIGLTILSIATYLFITKPPDQIITQGVYRFSRHPMYLATFLICLGSGMASGSWIFIILCIIMIFCFHKEALVEEKVCLEKYGDVYQEYQNQIPRWIGLPWRKKGW